MSGCVSRLVRESHLDSIGTPRNRLEAILHGEKKHTVESSLGELGYVGHFAMPRLDALRGQLLEGFDVECDIAFLAGGSHRIKIGRMCKRRGGRLLMFGHSLTGKTTGQIGFQARRNK